MSTAPSSAFNLLDERIQRWIWREGWSELREVQEEAILAIAGKSADVLVAASTASGKTEAAFLPLLTNMLTHSPRGVLLYVSPLKALINDQFGRLEQLCADLDIPVWPWHGDIAASLKTRFLKQPDGVVLITPESLEALLCTRGTVIPTVFKELRAIVVDELHAFMGEERGKQMQSLLHRLDVALGKSVPRIGLSATLGDMRLAAEFLRPGHGPDVTIIDAKGTGGVLQILVKGFVEPALPSMPSLRPQADDAHEDLPNNSDELSAESHIVAHLFKNLRGTNNLIFPNTRNQVERIANQLRALSEQNRVPNEFWPHHGSLSREIREEAEAALKSKQHSATAVCTATLELGIDIGAVKSVAQVGCPHSVASLRQRLGRSGRRKGDPAILRGYCIEHELTPSTHLLNQLRIDLVQLTAMVSLLLEGWFEPPPAGGLHYSTLIQQLMALISQRGGVSAGVAYQVLCASGPFKGISQIQFAELLRHMGKLDLLVQESSGLLLHGKKGERFVNHYSFYAAFATEEEYRLISGSKTLGSVPVSNALAVNDLILFAGKTWRVQQIEEKTRTVTVLQQKGGKAPRFSSGPGYIHETVRRRMRDIYESNEPVPFLDATASRLLDEGRQAYRRHHLETQTFVPLGSSTLIFTWLGDAANQALMMGLKQRGLSVIAGGPALEIANNLMEVSELKCLLKKIGAQATPKPTELLADAKNLVQEKWDWALPPDALKNSFASLKLDTPRAWDWLQKSI